ncbi:DnaD domain-containing protein [Domibacillus iocasae]|uniref:DnaB/C C-terminal domain-containing protein n=1 Tax=Domibacillus iocasae TaxID=1714016 RepID=A0A1E7DQB3_9BACI|nr:DnaD domain protein [Domibacillus iocasae]OES45261.1 hypothetical protein BA724_04430 [Domibacillus iocasae]
MAKFRMVHTAFWDDPKVNEEMTPEDRYFFLYLLTNGNTTQIGIYQITKKQMAFDMGYSIESINSLLQRFTDHHKIIKYSEKTREIAILNWGRFNFNKGGKPVMDCVRAELKMVKDPELIPFVAERIEKPEIKKIYDTYYDSLHDTSTSREKNENEDSKNMQMPLNQGFDDTSTIRGQEEEKEEEKEKEKEKEKEEEKEEEKEQQQEEQNADSRRLFSQQQNVSSFYQNNFGPETPYLTQEINYAVDEFGEELVIESMKIALTSGKRTWRYCAGILKNWRENNVKTLDDVAAVEAEFEHSKGVGKHGNSQTQYHQHNGHPEPLKRDSLTNGAVGWLGKGKREVSQVPGQASDYL